MKSGILYHFIPVDTLKYLIENDFTFKFRFNDIEPDTAKKLRFNHYLGFNTPYFLSLTRKYDFNWNPVRITFDGNKLSNNFRIRPIHFGNIEDFYDKDGRSLPKQDILTNQYEERLLSTKEYNNLKKYILSIDIIEDNALEINEIDNIPINKVDKFTRYGSLVVKKYHDM